MVSLFGSHAHPFGTGLMWKEETNKIFHISDFLGVGFNLSVRGIGAR